VQHTAAGTALNATQARFNDFLSQTHPPRNEQCTDRRREGRAVPAVPRVGQAAVGGALTVPPHCSHRPVSLQIDAWPEARALLRVTWWPPCHMLARGPRSQI
jgi:hypothetical protein